MAEQEVIKHTKRLYKIVSDSRKGFTHKLTDLFIETLIIVFAVSLTIWFHERSEHSHEQREVKIFMNGIKNELISDTASLIDDKLHYIKLAEAAGFVANTKKNDRPGKDTAEQKIKDLFLFRFSKYDSKRFNGFNSSGKMVTIEDKKLEADLMDLFDSEFSNIQKLEDFLYQYQTNAFGVLGKKYKSYSDTTNNVGELLKDDEFKINVAPLTFATSTTPLIDSCLVHARHIIYEIDANYK